eukprot:scaffold3586_cov404-Prasinococcus_capsulatus_cf.AAC.4
MGLLMLDGLSKVAQVSHAELGLGTGGTIVDAVVADPWIAVKLSDESVVIYEATDSSFTRLMPPDGQQSHFSGVSSFTLASTRRYGHGDSFLHELLAGMGSAQSNGVIGILMVGNKEGIMRVFSVPRLQAVGEYPRVQDMPRVLRCTLSSGQDAISNGHEAMETGQEALNEPGPEMAELCLHIPLKGTQTPFLLLRFTDGSIAAYKAFRIQRSRAPSLGFSRVGGEPILALSLQPSTGLTPNNDRMFVPYNHVGGQHGVVLCGPDSHWMMIRRGDLVIHPQQTDRIVAFTPFHNVNCAFGCIFYSAGGFLKICQLPPTFNYNTEWLTQKIPLRASPNCLAVQPQSSLVVAAVSYSVPPERKPPPPAPAAEDELPKPQYDWRQAHELLLLAGPQYDIVDRFQFEIGEHALVVRCVSLKGSDGTTREMYAIGTAFVGVEDQAVKGNITLVELVEDTESTEAGGDIGARHRFHHVLSKEIKGGVTAACSLEGHLVVAGASKILVFQLREKELSQISFFDAPIYTTTLNTVKNFILIGDLQQSVFFLRWKEENHTLTLLSQDFGGMEVTASEFVVDGSTLAMVVADNLNNAQIFAYMPQSQESWQGKKLLSKAEFYTGCSLSKFVRVKASPRATSLQAALRNSSVP